MKPVCLTIAGSDSSAGAGIQADLKTFASLGCHSATVITALTAQNTVGVRSVCAMEPDFVLAQLDAVMSDMPVVAIKIGMLANKAIIKIVAGYLSQVKLPIVLDPVLISSSGAELLEPNAIEFLRQELVPLSCLITPNLEEAACLDRQTNHSPVKAETAAGNLIKAGANAVLITGGDQHGIQKRDCFVMKNGNGETQANWYEHETVNTHNSHGTGCTLSTAITAYLAHGMSLAVAVEKGIKHTHQLLRLSIDQTTGSGRGGLDHFPFIRGGVNESFYK